ncbi:Aste57867_5197 [Aphanomyces stellatus]|uniref:Aste57867_5197 protein n=1 Tax=Aphanomyces stellatus TaxID=120398 RepID=A0A485KGH4_9STRA|nr:hypothetical protein As57867_005184 [Aphanomyces stellatus]VFT82270.1 Aste57867_5197 [Aphanomyces stellatus]
MATRIRPFMVRSFLLMQVSNKCVVKSGFSPDSDFIVSGSVDQNVYIWDVQSTGAPAAVLCGHQGEVSSVAWCKSDFTKIASCSDDGTVRVWHIGRDDLIPEPGPNSCGRGCDIGHAETYPELPQPIDTTAPYIWPTLPHSSKYTF